MNLSVDDGADIVERRACVYAMANCLYHEYNQDTVLDVGVRPFFPEPPSQVRCKQSFLLKASCDYFEFGDGEMQSHATRLFANMASLQVLVCVLLQLSLTRIVRRRYVS